MQKAADELGFKIGFLFQDEKTFEEGLKNFRSENPTAGPRMDEYLRETRREWQNDLADFRNKFVEHSNEDRAKFQKFY